jgi:hypothetical protein
MPRYDYTVSFRDARKAYVSVRAAVIIPAGAALAAGCMAGLAAGSIAWALEAGEPLKVAAAAAGVAALAALVSALRWWREIVTSIEAAHLAASSPNVAFQPMRIEIPTGKQNVRRFEKLPVTRGQLIRAAKLVTSGGTLSVRTLTQVFTSSAEAQAFQTALVAGGYAEWRNAVAPTQGIRVTEKGMALFEETIRTEATAGLSPTSRGLITGGRGYYQEHARTQDDWEEE